MVLKFYNFFNLEESDFKTRDFFERLGRTFLNSVRFYNASFGIAALFLAVSLSGLKFSDFVSSKGGCLTSTPELLNSLNFDDSFFKAFSELLMLNYNYCLRRSYFEKAVRIYIYTVSNLQNYVRKEQV